MPCARPTVASKQGEGHEGAGSPSPLPGSPQDRCAFHQVHPIEAVTQSHTGEQPTFLSEPLDTKPQTAATQGLTWNRFCSALCYLVAFQFPLFCFYYTSFCLLAGFQYFQWVTQMSFKPKCL